MPIRVTALWLAIAGAIGCQTGYESLTPLSVGGTHILFIGNSLTSVNDLPGTLASLALTTGDTIKTQQVTFPDFALVDYLASGFSRVMKEL